MDQFVEHKVERRQFLYISWDYIRLTVALFYVVSMTTVWMRPPIKPTSAVISSPKSFVIALICILQLSVLAHSKNNQPPLKTGDSIIIISVDLYKTLVTSLCLTLVILSGYFYHLFSSMYIFCRLSVMHRQWLKRCHLLCSYCLLIYMKVKDFYFWDYHFCFFMLVNTVKDIFIHIYTDVFMFNSSLFDTVVHLTS